MQFVDFYFDFSSTNSYFAAFLLPEICARNGARVNWMPTHFAALFRGTGFDVMAMTPRKARYLWRDHARYADLTGLPFKRPSRFPIKTASALRAVLAAARIPRPDDDATVRSDDDGIVHPDDDGAVRELAQRCISQAIMRAYWEHDADISNRAVLESIASSAGFDGVQLMELAQASAARDELAALTETAVARGVFGAPTFFVGNEMFWGKDRLDFVERCLKPSQ